MGKKIEEEKIVKKNIESQETTTKTESIDEEKPVKAPKHWFKKKETAEFPKEKIKKDKKDKYKKWETCKLVSIDSPLEITSTKDKNRFKLSFKYQDSDGKVKKKTIRFGKRGTEYLIDHKDDYRNKKWLSKQRGYYTPFHKNFWISCILCTENEIDKAYKKAIYTLL